MSIEDFSQTGPAFLPEEFFVGKLKAWAIFESLTGGLQKRATIVAEGKLEGATNSIEFVETYTFDGGHTDTLRWTIRKSGPGKYSGTENRVEGNAEGEQAGCAFHWKYTRDVPQADGKFTRLNFDDWFYRIDERACMVRGTAGRAGLPLVTAHVTYVKLT